MSHCPYYFTMPHANITPRISPLRKTICTSRDLDTNLAQRPTIQTGLRRKYYAGISSFAPVILSYRISSPFPSGILRYSIAIVPLYGSSNFYQPRDNFYFYSSFFCLLQLVFVVCTFFLHQIYFKSNFNVKSLSSLILLF